MYRCRLDKSESRGLREQVQVYNSATCIYEDSDRCEQTGTHIWQESNEGVQAATSQRLSGHAVHVHLNRVEPVYRCKSNLRLRV